MNILIKLILRIASSPKIDMQEDYVWIRRIQNFFSKNSIQNYHYLDEKIYSSKEDHEIPVRMFYPKDKTKRMRIESIIYIHGGGWTIGSIDSYSGACQNIADEFGRIVYSIDYRLAPEYTYPVPFEDCFQAVEQLMAQEDAKGKQNWVLMGDSSGGNLAAAVSLKLKEEKKRLPNKQILLYPVTYWDHTRHSPFKSVQTKGYDYGLTIKKIQEYMENYVPDEQERKEPYVAPLTAADLRDQPYTLIITAEHDPLRDEGEAYGRALKKAGNKITVHRIPNSVHGFIRYPAFAQPLEEAFEVIHTFLEK